MADTALIPVVRSLVSAYYKAKAVRDRTTALPQRAFDRIIEREIEELFDAHGAEKVFKASLYVAEGELLHRTALDTVTRSMSRVHKERLEKEIREREARSAANSRSFDLVVRQCTQPTTITTFSGDFNNALRTGITCSCADGIFCNWLHRKIGDDDLASMFRSMRAKFDAFVAAGSGKKMMWAVPMFGKMILNIDTSFLERASWDGETDELYVELDYSTPRKPNMFEVRSVGGMNSRTYQELVEHKQIFFMNGLVGPGQDEIFRDKTGTAVPCKSRDHDGFRDNKRVLEWAAQTENQHMCAKFCMHYFGVCYLCIYRNDPEMLRNNVTNVF